MRYGKEFGKDIVEIDADARAILERYAYPGNIRELQNIMERATISARDERSPPVAFRASCKNPAHRLSWLPPREISGLSVST